MSKDNEEEFQIPDGRWGWIVCFSGFMINFTIVGIITSHGIIVLGLIQHFNETMSKVALVGTLFLGAEKIVGPFVLFLMKHNTSHRQIIMMGGLLATLSTIASVFVKQIELLYVTYGILSGCFTGMSYFAGQTIVGSYFQKKRALAVGIACSGGGCGGFFLSYLIERSISFYGMRGTFLLISGLYLNLLVYSSLCRPLRETINRKDKKINEIYLDNGKKTEIKDRIDMRTTSAKSEKCEFGENCETLVYGETRKSDSLTIRSKINQKCNQVYLAVFDPIVFKDTEMLLLLTTYFFWSTNEAVLIYLPSKVNSVGLNREQAALVMSAFAAANAISQLTVGIIADLIHIPITHILTASMVGLSIVSLSFTFCRVFFAFAICACLFAIFNGFIGSLRVVLVANILGVKNINKGFSPLCILIAIGYVLYPTLAGLLYDTTKTLDSVYYLGASFFLVASLTSIKLISKQQKANRNK